MRRQICTFDIQKRALCTTNGETLGNFLSCFSVMRKMVIVESNSQYNQTVGAMWPIPVCCVAPSKKERCFRKERKPQENNELFIIAIQLHAWEMYAHIPAAENWVGRGREPPIVHKRIVHWTCVCTCFRSIYDKVPLQPYAKVHVCPCLPLSSGLD